MAILVLENILQKRLRGCVTDFIGQMDGFVIVFDCAGFGIQVRLDLLGDILANVKGFSLLTVGRPSRKRILPISFLGVLHFLDCPLLDALVKPVVAPVGAHTG